MTANTTPTLAFRKGGSAAEEAEKEANANNGGRKGPDYFSLKEDKASAVIRLLTDHDDWLYVEQHSFVPTKPAPKGSENWPKSMTSVCRKDPAFAGHYGDCYICDNKIKNNFGKVASSRIRIWALAIERELVRGDGTEALGGPTKQGIVIGVRDKVDEVDEIGPDDKPTGNKLRYPRLLLINQPMKGFFSNLKALHGLYGTVCDRDFEITRDGTGTDTNYKIVPIDPIPEIKPGTPAWVKYLESVTEREVVLEAIVAEKASDEYYARFFDPAKDVDKDGNVVAAGTVTASTTTGGMANLPAASAPDDISPDLRSRIAALGVPDASAA
ncbi:hypothetical protein E6R60_26310 [Streptomyces sp. A0642]|uniref:hypothetical protein n=1 Tax=Streptomyces sp. A0642 TaxID=2563100 RepID=UPI0010A27427|nr:hypothetical protein [Streptomyces sp. A0642]THA72449.1 hypothetical protein E6R60_26310 [Streptomyces sp. A0642]